MSCIVQVIVSPAAFILPEEYSVLQVLLETIVPVLPVCVTAAPFMAAIHVQARFLDEPLPITCGKIPPYLYNGIYKLLVPTMIDKNNDVNVLVPAMGIVD